jgi:hypothetical protein
MDKLSRKTPLRAADLFVLLEREFMRRRPRECDECNVQLPFRVRDPSPERANWEILTTGACALGCEDVLQEVAAQLQRRYELAEAS